MKITNCQKENTTVLKQPVFSLKEISVHFFYCLANTVIQLTNIKKSIRGRIRKKNMTGILCTDIDAGGGVESVSKRLDTQLNESGIKSKIYSLKSAESYKNAFGFNIPTEKLNDTDIQKIIEKIKSDSVDNLILQLNSPYCPLANINLYKKLCHEETALYSVYHNSPKSFISRYKYFDDSLPLFFIKWLKTRIIFSPHGKKFIQQSARYSRVVTISEGCRDEIKKYYGVNSAFIPNCFNISISDASVLKNKKHTMAFLGRIDYESKNFKLLLNSWMKVKDKKDWKLEIFGHGDKIPINNYILKKKITNIDVKDSLTTDKVLKFLEANSVIVLTSYHEGFPTILAEASARGNAIITTHYDGFSDEIAKNGKNGFVTDFSAKKIAEKMQNLINDNELLREQQANSLEIIKEYVKNYNAIEKWREVL